MPDEPTLARHARLAVRWRAYAVALVLTLTMLGLRSALTSTLENRHFLIIFLLPIIVSAYLGGLWPGLFSTLLAALVTAWFVIPPVGSFAFETPVEIGRASCRERC